MLRSWCASFLFVLLCAQHQIERKQHIFQLSGAAFGLSRMCLMPRSCILLYIWTNANIVSIRCAMYTMCMHYAGMHGWATQKSLDKLRQYTSAIAIAYIFTRITTAKKEPHTKQNNNKKLNEIMQRRRRIVPMRIKCKTTSPKTMLSHTCTHTQTFEWMRAQQSTTTEYLYFILFFSFNVCVWNMCVYLARVFLSWETQFFCCRFILHK